MAFFFFFFFCFFSLFHWDMVFFSLFILCIVGMSIGVFFERGLEEKRDWIFSFICICWFLLCIYLFVYHEFKVTYISTYIWHIY